MHLCTPIPSEMMAFELKADNMLEGLSLLFSPEDTASLISNKKCKTWTRLAVEYFSTLKQSVLNEPWPTGHVFRSPCSHMASFLFDRVLVGICRWHGGLCLPTVVSGSIPGPI